MENDDMDLVSVESGELAALHVAATPEMRDALGLSFERVGGALLSIASAAPPSAIVVNRAIGLGTESPAAREDVRAIVERYRAAGVSRFFVHVERDAAPSLRAWLEEAGLERARGWMKFERGVEPPPERVTELEIVPAGSEHMEAFGRIVAQAFDLGEALAPWLSRLDRAPGFRAYVSLDGEEVCGTGALFVEGRVGWLDMGATAPNHRRRGSQGALMRRRILDAISLGVDHIYTATGEAVAGDPQHSYGNITRMGFRELRVRDNYAPPKR